ncbi:hypothetical protein AAFN85_31215 [Mucilaginibacter sp. CAU 1740]|uniref:hypothetical protein n=1 Tax=Mucilaginibacter sp. CAU 1740 TaxID=3140365 RepID=UPI00325AED4A
MIGSTLLEMIKAYLSQELPPPYNTFISIENTDIVISLPSDIQDVFITFDYLYRIIADDLGGIPNFNVNIILRTQNESRSFQIGAN